MLRRRVSRGCEGSRAAQKEDGNVFGNATARGGQLVFHGARMWDGLVKKARFVTVVVVVAARKAGEEEKRTNKSL